MGEKSLGENLARANRAQAERAKKNPVKPGQGRNTPDVSASVAWGVERHDRQVERDKRAGFPCRW
jgi:hypothetical protein